MKYLISIILVNNFIQVRDKYYFQLFQMQNIFPKYICYYY